jgi:hypothetical protein
LNAKEKNKKQGRRSRTGLSLLSTPFQDQHPKDGKSCLA